MESSKAATPLEKGKHSPRHLRVFLASPGDVAEERKYALGVLEQLNYDPFIRGRVTLEAVAWDKPGGGAPMLAGMTPQEAIARGLPRPSECDIVVVILWSRMGTPLPSDYLKPDRSPYISGTEWEYMDALRAGKNGGHGPEILLYRRTEKVLLDPDEPDFEDKALQRKKVQAFFEGFRNLDGSLSGGVNDYGKPQDFKELLTHNLRSLIERLLPATEPAHCHIEQHRKGGASDYRAATRHYLDFVQDKHQYLNFKGMGIADRVPLKLPLLDLYVPLKARLELPPGEKAGDRRWTLAGRGLAVDELETNGLRLGEPQPVLDLLQQQDGLVILGDPGSGKTTFLKYLALQLATGNHDAVGLGERLPILVPLSGFANELEKNDIRLDDYIADYFHQSGGDWPVKELLNEALQCGLGLVLLDGLDEVADLALRHLVVERVCDFYLAHRRGSNKFVITSRIIGYREVRPSAPGLAECTLVDFSEEEIGEFVERWTLALEAQAQGETDLAKADAVRERHGLLDAVCHNPGVRQLAANPLLLTILALMKRQGVSLPERRVELYETYVKTLLSSWNRVRGLGRPPSRDMDPVQTVKVLAPLALWMHEVNPGVGLVKREDLRRELETIYRNRGDADFESTARQFLNDVHQHAGLLLERGPGEFGFIHLTFEEYLAAAAIALRHQGDAEAIANELGRRVGQPAWHEIIRLAIGYVGLVQQLDSVAGKVVEALANQQPGPPGEAVVLAGEAVADVWPAGMTPSGKQRTVAALIPAMQGSAVGAALRRQAGMLLGRLGWRPDDLDVFLEIPAGRFFYGDERKPREIPYRYWISRYLVTNFQFARFIEAGGYRQPEWWSEIGWKWLQPNDIRQPVLWGDTEWNNPIFPVVGVSWHEALAYGRWLDAALRSMGLQTSAGLMKIPETCQIRLPAEWEWERAARGVDGLEYPWGKDFNAAFANIADENWNSVTGGSTAVCTYPQGVSPVGAWDMAGNVWEWCLNKYEQTDDLSLEGADRRVLRGGSWYLGPRSARASYRHYYDPGPRRSVGFRVVCASPIVGL